jgi:hypothetical protein
LQITEQASTRHPLNHTMKTEYTIIINGKKSGHIMLDDGGLLKLKDLGFKPYSKYQPKVLFLNK